MEATVQPEIIDEIEGGFNGTRSQARVVLESLPDSIGDITNEERNQFLRRLVLREWRQHSESIGDGSVPSKDDLRRSHAVSRLEILQRDRRWISMKAHKLLSWFANGCDIDRNKIAPRLIQVESNEHSDVFRLARYTWSLPYSKGFGRRLRFLIVDDSNNKLIGVLGLQSPPMDFSLRDRKLAFAPGRKVELVNQTMDIYVQGAVPPYNVLLGGKLSVMTAAAKEVREAYHSRYEGRLTEMEGNQLPSHLVAVTTTSAYGKSSLYNRVVFEKDGQRYKVAESLGYAKGYGSFQFSETTYRLLKEFVRDEIPGRQVAGFGSGPRVKWQVITLATQRLGINTSMLRHGIQREAYLIRLIDNLESYFSGEEKTPKYRDWDFSELAAFWKSHYLLGPRRQRPQSWQAWDREQILGLVLPDEAQTTSLR